MIRSHRIWLIAILVGLVVLVLLVLGVIEAIHQFGTDEVQAFAGTMSFLAVAIAAIVTCFYVIETRDIANATRENAQAQTRIANLMEKDLTFRVMPYLRYEPDPGGSPANHPRALISNLGRGTALHVTAMAKCSDGDKDLLTVPALETQEKKFVEFSLSPTDGGFFVAIKCTDSVNLNDYSFSWNNAGQLVEWKSTPRQN